MKAYISLLAGAALLAGCSQSASTSGAASAATSATPAEATAGASAAPTASTSSATPAAARIFPSGNQVARARITELTGVDTANASMSGRINEADAREYCEGMPAGPNGREPTATCVAGIIEQQGVTVMSAGADCTARRLNFSGDEYTPVRPDPENAGYLIFRSEEHSILQSNSGAGGGLVLNDLFSTLCPAAFRAAGGTQLNP